MKKSRKRPSKKIEKKEPEKKTMKPYISYHTRIFINSFLFIVFFTISIFLLNKSFSIIKKKDITYQEKSHLDYKVYLKDNDFYNEKYLGKDKIYVASLIDNIEADFDYDFYFSEKKNITYQYDITATLEIKNKDGTNTFFSKDYPLMGEKIVNKDSKSYKINELVTIDYNYYNDLASKFRSNYGLDITSNLIVRLNIKEENKELEFKNNSNMMLTIPLSEREVSIAMDYKEVNHENKVIKNRSVIINSYLYIIIAFLLLVVGVIFFIRLIKLINLLKNKESKYDKYIKKILREYDRLIVNTTTAPVLEGKDVIKIDSFNELLDVRDNLKLPIKYYIVVKHQKCNFYISTKEELYLFVVKKVDMENHDEK